MTNNKELCDQLWSKCLEKDVVRLNVGGTWFTTARATMEKYPDSLFPQIMGESAKGISLKKQQPVGFYFIDRDGSLFGYILNFLRSGELVLPRDFKDYDMLLSEAKFYRLPAMESSIRQQQSRVRDHAILEVAELAHPEKIGLCCTRLILNDYLQEKKPFCDILTDDHGEGLEAVQGPRGRSWFRTTLTRADWGEILRQHGWDFMGMTSFARKLPDITGQGTDLCHVVEKWSFTGRL